MIALPNRQQGVVLLEALIAILIFSMGILALVGMQAAAITSVSEAKYRADASFLANQIIGQMWLNRINLASYACDPCTVANGNADTQTWVAQLQPGGDYALPGSVANPPRIAIGAGNQVAVTVFWQPPDTATAHSFSEIAYIN